MKRELDPEFRVRLRAWAERSAALPPAEVAARARAGRVPRRGARARPLLTWTAAALAAAVVATIGLARREPVGPHAPAPRVSARPAAPVAGSAPRVLVLELRSGSRLYVDLAAGRRTS